MSPDGARQCGDSENPPWRESGERRQLRDAVIFEAYIREARDIFVTKDHKAFIRDGRREKLEATLKTQIMLLEEFKSLLQKAAQAAGTYR